MHESGFFPSDEPEWILDTTGPVNKMSQIFALSIIQVIQCGLRKSVSESLWSTLYGNLQESLSKTCNRKIKALPSSRLMGLSYLRLVLASMHNKLMQKTMTMLFRMTQYQKQLYIGCKVGKSSRVKDMQFQTGTSVCDALPNLIKCDQLQRETIRKMYPTKASLGHVLCPCKKNLNKQRIFGNSNFLFL